MNEQTPSSMRPQMGDAYITLPITFDYHGGRKDSQKTRKIWAAIIAAIGLIIIIGILFNKEKSFWSNLVTASILSIVLFFGIRFFMLGEKGIRDNYKDMISRDLKLDDNVLWGIYEVGDAYPYICRYRSGKSGVFIGLNKDVILGKYEESEYEHYEAIGDAYNLAGASRVQIIHIDYMDNVGTDERLENSFSSLGEVSNPDLKSLLTEVFSYQQEQMMQTVTTFDVYAFLWTGSDNVAWETIQRVLACFLDANYRSYHVLNALDLRELTKVVFNLEEFSVVKASSNTFESAGHSRITPITFVDAQGIETKLGKTRSELKAEAEQAEKEKEAIEREKKRRKKSGGFKKSKKKDETIDIFEE